MITALLRKEIQQNRWLVLAFLGLALLLLFLIQYVYGHLFSDAANVWDLVGYIHGLALPVIFTFFIAANLVAGEKESGTFAGLAALPVAPGTVWLIKFAFGFLVVIGFSLAMIIISLPGDAINWLAGFPVYYALLLAIYSCAFFGSCLTKNGLAGVLLGLLIAIVVAGIGAAVYIVGAFAWSGSHVILRNVDMISLASGAGGSTHSIYSQTALPVITLSLSAIIALQSWLWFRWTHRRFPVRIRAVLVLPTLLAAVLFVWVAALCYVNHPSRFTFTPRFDTSPVFDTSRRHGYEELHRLTNAWDRELMADQGGLRELEAWWNNPSDTVPQAVRQLVTKTNDLRERALTYLLRHDYSASYDPKNDIMPRYMVLLTIFRLEAIATTARAQRGDYLQSQERLERMLTVTEHFSGQGFLIHELVGYACINITPYAITQLYPLYNPTMSSVTARKTLQLLDQNERVLAGGLESGFLCEAAVMEHTITSFSGSYARYPLANPDFMRQEVHDEFFRLMQLSRADYWTIKDQLDRDPRRVRSPLQNLLHPVQTVFTDIAVPRLATVITRKAETISRLRLMQIQAGLYWYCLENGALPDTLGQLRKFIAARGVTEGVAGDRTINPLTGQEFPYPDIIDGDQVNLDYARANRY